MLLCRVCVCVSPPQGTSIEATRSKSLQMNAERSLLTSHGGSTAGCTTLSPYMGTHGTLNAD